MVSAALFLCVGVIYDRMHTREIAAYGGLVNRMPLYAAVFMVFTLANVGLPGTSGFQLLEKVKKDDRFHNLPVIVYTGQELTRRDETKLKKYAQTVIIKTVGSPERLLDEATRFLHRPEAALPAEQR